jgi:hypothetical protein
VSREKRGAPRRDIRLKGLIVDLSGSIVGECMIVNVSATGAKLTLQNPKNVPDSFVLLLAKKGGVRRQCDVAWRSDSSIGVRFATSQSAPQEALTYISDMLARIAPDTLHGD